MVREMIQKTLDYVDSNIKEDITAEELAEVAGYSVFHFYRLFQSAVGIPVMQYVLRRKLLYVIYEIGLERKKNEVVYEYGFETYSGFYRAFIREIGYVTVGELYFTLTRKVEGERVMASGIYLDDYKEKARFIGEIVGQLDLALAKIDTIVDEADLGKSVRAWAVPALKGKIDMNPEAMEKYTAQFCDLYRALPRQVIHRDPNPSNIILAKDKWGFIDFELSEENARIFDPCYAATAILSETFEEENEDKLLTWVEVMKEIMYGYDSVVKLTDAEKKAIPYMILANQFVSTAFFAGKDKYEELYRTNKAMTEWIGTNMDKLSIS